MSHAGAIYTIQDLVNDKVLVTHIHNLRPFNYDAERTDPVTVAQQNAQEFVIEQVLGAVQDSYAHSAAASLSARSQN